MGTYLKYTFFPSASCFLPGKVPKRSAFEVFQTSITLANVHELWLIITCWVKISCHKCLPPKPLGFFLTSQIILQDLVKRSSAFAHPRRTLKYYSTLVWLSEILPFMRPHLWCSSSPLISDAILHVLSLQMIFMCPHKDVFFFFHVPSSQVFLLGFFFHVSSANLS